ncbi:MAG: 2-dehydropantoate 2-reductase [Candidatus Omnitrophica bacterium]|nr:2-dehydropantoate 2-reductase [Candidatus Omnitrophota bacterium]
MKIVVVGPGALGCLLAASIKNRTREDVWLFDNMPERAKKISENGIKVEGVSGQFTARVNTASSAKDIGVCDLVILCVKSYSTEEACRDIKELVGTSTSVLTLQNGIGNVQIMNDQFGAEKVMAGVTNHGATLLGIGHVRHAGKADTTIGRADGRVLGAIREVANVLSKAGFETKISKDIESVIWSKLIINAGINALTAVTRLNNGALVEYDECRQVMRCAVQEAVRLVKRKRIKLSYDDPIQKVESVCRATASNVSSMLQDVLNRKKTEIDFINGAIVRQAKALAIPTPINEVLTNLVKTIESSYEKQLREK